MCVCVCVHGYIARPLCKRVCVYAALVCQRLIVCVCVCVCAAFVCQRFISSVCVRVSVPCCLCRLAYVYKSSTVPCGSARYTVTAEGVRDCEPC